MCRALADMHLTLGRLHLQRRRISCGSPGRIAIGSARVCVAQNLQVNWKYTDEDSAVSKATCRETPCGMLHVQAPFS